MIRRLRQLMCKHVLFHKTTKDGRWFLTCFRGCGYETPGVGGLGKDSALRGALPNFRNGTAGENADRITLPATDVAARFMDVYQTIF